MALVNYEQHEALAMLKTDLLEAMENNRFVNVHIYSNLANVSHCIIPEDVIIDESLVISEHHFEFNVDLDQVKSFDITQDEYEHCYNIRCDDLHIDFCFH